jgi:thymidylate synthase ThyX
VEIIVIDGRDVPNPEDLAMLLALYSRDPRSVRVHLEQVRKRGSSSFMQNFYCGYGHKSIGDCGTTAVCFEQVSMLAAKAVQDTPLYNGQEASTRYLDMAAQPVLNPLGTPEGEAVQKAWMALYSEALLLLVPSLKEKFPRKDGESEKDWEKAIKARAFDIARSLLPAGATTYVAWATNLRQANDHLKEMRNHPLAEIAALGVNGHADLMKVYPSSFSHKVNEAEEAYIRKSMSRFAYFWEDIHGFGYTSNLDLKGLSEPAERDLLATRPPRTELHQRFRRYGSITFKDRIDFGSYRDLQRQRSAVQEMPLLTTRWGFHPWYLANLPPEIVEKTKAVEKATNALEATDIVRQFYCPMGLLVPVVIDCTLPSAVYIAELRSGDTVHQTLRIFAQKMGETLRQIVPHLAMHHDMTPEPWNVKRGKQDIVKKEQEVK